ncbi:ArsR/SmtB family transcription factor [Nocardioides luteus]|uniref:ArsR/SmtB family transcription factor n=1 Tax=Nocardioides luteus TaxID=1844 RepID=UPI0018C9F00A|nr:metalloregulator ArsR/SmtB family transcription factor [Nocardioides luteus]MBG6097935.1 rhodanese-related sulfurtransferase [Nocardioides luteus]
MGDRKAKDALYDTLAEAAKALANGRRAELVDVLAQGERPVEDLAGEIGQSIANTSQHLQRLLRAGLVTSRRDGNRIFYSLSSPTVLALWQTLRDTAAQHVAELDRVAGAYLGNRDELSTITRDELRKRLRAGDVVVLDVRPRPEYDAGHVRGALSIPNTELRNRLAELPDGTTVVAYCRGPYCVYADDAVRTLRAAGRDALRLEDGYPEWAASRLPITASARSGARQHTHERRGA